jgi:hypothetical protein
MAGIYDGRTGAAGTELRSCAIITTEANKLMARIHDRMPIFVRPEDEVLWLDSDVRDADALRAARGENFGGGGGMTSKTVDGRLGLVLIIGGLSMFAPLSMDLYLPALPSLTRDLGGSASLVQLTLTACLLGLAAGQLIAGPLSDSLCRRRPLFVGLVAYTLASLLCAFAPSVPPLVVLRLIHGTAGAAGLVIAQAVVRDVYEGSDMARFLALTMLISGLAPDIGPVLGGQLLHFTSWRGAFVSWPSSV